MYRLCPFLLFLQIAQKLNVCEEVQQNKDEYQEEIRIEELCPCVCNSIEEFLFMPIQFEHELDQPLEHFVEPVWIWDGIQAFL